ncbi:FecR domain-containing protein [Chitinophaga sp. YIM B06452]|uniref:FecR family protein n=1 Tax=Chitinophaga sp. YIM B06452 TaxID=3082158 RepID=UPI0031FE514D
MYMTPAEKENELRLLFEQWLNGAGDEQTLNRLSVYADDPDVQHTWQQLLDDAPAAPAAVLPRERQQQVIDTVYARLSSAIPALHYNKPVHRMRPWAKYAAAACLLVLTGALGYLFFREGGGPKETAPVAFNVVPGNTNKAVLTLANGATIVLDSAANGQLARQAGATVSKTEEGQVAYREADSWSIAGQADEYNTIQTPNGGEYKVMLSDGTAVWLNAASTITFPVAFTGSERRVSISGEAYFEVARNPRKPFKVEANGAVVEVLGTHFNVSAYPADAIHHATLLEGKIRLMKDAESVLLKPGQQARFGENAPAISVTTPENAEDAVAWKSGTFNFNNLDLATVMNQVSRWYNVDVRYEGGKPQASIVGVMNRSTDLATVLKSLELTSGVHFTLEKGPERGTIIVRQ